MWSPWLIRMPIRASQNAAFLGFTKLLIVVQYTFYISDFNKFVTYIKKCLHFFEDILTFLTFVKIFRYALFGGTMLM